VPYASARGCHLLRVLITSAAVTSSALLVLGLVPLSAAQAATSAGQPPPSACKTFTSKSADALFGVRHGTRLTRHLKTVPDKGAALCKFALAQSRAYKG